MATSTRTRPLQQPSPHTDDLERDFAAAQVELQAARDAIDAPALRLAAAQRQMRILGEQRINQDRIDRKRLLANAPAELRELSESIDAERIAAADANRSKPSRKNDGPIKLAVVVLPFVNRLIEAGAEAGELPENYAASKKLWYAVCAQLENVESRFQHARAVNAAPELLQPLRNEHAKLEGLLVDIVAAACESDASTRFAAIRAKL